MSVDPTKKLTNLPNEFRAIFLKTSHQMRTFGNGILLADLAFVVTELAFATEFDDEVRESAAESFRDVVYEAHSQNRQFVDEKTRDLAEHQEEYLQGLYAQGLIYLWSSIETLFRELVAALIKYDRTALDGKTLAKVEAPIKYFQLEPDKQASYFAKLVIDKLKCRDKRGSDRFDCILDAFGLDIKFDYANRRTLQELHALRNCIVHNDSIADKEFCEATSWMHYKVGDKISIDRDAFRVYERAVQAYFGEIFYRLNRKFGASDEFLNTVRKILDGILAEHSDKP